MEQILVAAGCAAISAAHRVLSTPVLRLRRTVTSISGGPEPLLKALIDGSAGIETLAIERPGLHDAFVAIAGGAAADAMGREEEAQ